MSKESSSIPHFTNALDQFFSLIKNDASLSKAVPFIMAGDPSIKQTHDIASILYNKGVRMIEIGMPFSDPGADGPIIQLAGQRALKNHIKLEDIFACAVKIKDSCPDMAIVLMGYYNPIRAFGEKKFAEVCASSHIDGVIIVDLPPEHDESLQPHLIEHQVHFIRLLAHNTTPERMKYLLSLATGCVYQVAVSGVTGAKAAVISDIEHAVARIRKISDIPVITGFGVRTAADIHRLTEHANAAVIGSALVNAISQSRGGGAPQAAERFWDTLSES